MVCSRTKRFGRKWLTNLEALSRHYRRLPTERRSVDVSSARKERRRHSGADEVSRSNWTTSIDYRIGKGI
jgi:hypothetical protein